jgi:hypothetical protein
VPPSPDLSPFEPDRPAERPERLTCHRCGSTKLRRSHSRNRAQKLLRRLSALDRYACGACGNRGWCYGKVEVAAETRRRVARRFAPTLGPDGRPAGRPLEKRDRRLRRRVRTRTFLTVLGAVLLGVLAALYLQRCGTVVTPPTE